MIDDPPRTREPGACTWDMGSRCGVPPRGQAAGGLRKGSGGNHGLARGTARAQWYLRAEPTDEARELLRTHQAHLAHCFRDLRLSPRLIDPRDLHWTVLFLGSAERWNAALRALGKRTCVSPEDILSWADVPELHRPLPSCTPEAYDVFYKGETSAVFVLHLQATSVIADAVVEHVRSELAKWEREGRLSRGVAQRLFRIPLFPLARAVRDPRPHITFARGRVSRQRQRDVARSIRGLTLVSATTLTFGDTDIRAVRDGRPSRP